MKRNSKLPPGRHIAKAVRKVEGPQTAGQAFWTIGETHKAAAKEVIKHNGRVLGEPRVYVTVEVDFINE